MEMQAWPHAHFCVASDLRMRTLGNCNVGDTFLDTPGMLSDPYIRLVSHASRENEGEKTVVAAFANLVVIVEVCPMISSNIPPPHVLPTVIG